MKPIPWVVIHCVTQGDDALTVECLHCGEKLRVSTPLSIKVLGGICDAFEGEHAKCKEREEPGE